MAHLILPIEIDGIKYCRSQGDDDHTIGYAPWRTEDLISEHGMVIIEKESDDYWYIIRQDASTQTIKFGVSCIDFIEFQIYCPTLGAGEEILADVYVNGALGGSMRVAEFISGDDCTVAVAEGACGAVIEIIITGSGGEVELGILDVL